MSRARVAGLTTTDFFLGHIVTQSVLGIIQIGILTLVLQLAFKFVIKGHISHFVVICFLVCLSSASLGV